MKFSRNLIPMVFCCALIVNISACGHCGGCDTISTTNGANLIVEDPVSALQEGSETTLAVRGILEERKGTRKCHKRDMTLCLEDELEAGKLALRCDRDLALKASGVAAGTDLLSLQEIVQESDYTPFGGNFLLVHLIQGSSFEAGTYTFVLTGTTKEGKAVSDTATIIWK